MTLLRNRPACGADKITKLTARARLRGRLLKTGLPVSGVVAGIVLVVALFWQSTNHFLMPFSLWEESRVTQIMEDGVDWRNEPESDRSAVKKGDSADAYNLLTALDMMGIYPQRDKEILSDSIRYRQNLRFRRSMEAELAQNIMAIDAVSYARVHFGSNKPTAFILNHKPDRTATVMLRLRNGQPLTEEQVAAIVSLVAGSVPDLKSERVRVMDQLGSQLSARLAGQSERGSEKAFSNALSQLRQETERRLADVLTPAVGSKNFRISVVPRYNLNPPAESQDRFLCKPATATGNLQQRNSVSDLLSIRLAHQPAVQDREQADFPFCRQVPRRHGEERTISPSGFPLEKLSVAVALNKNAGAVSAWVADNPALILLKQAAGIDAQRGDTLTLSLLNFTLEEPLTDPDLALRENVRLNSWIERGEMLAILVLVTLPGLLPVLHRLVCRNGLTPQVRSRSGSETAPQIQRPPSVRRSEESILPPQDSELGMKIACLRTLAESESERVAEVIRRWINSDNVTENKNESGLSASDKRLSRQEQAAILLLSIGEEAAAGALSKMPGEERRRLRETIAHLHDVRLTQARQALNNFFDDYRQP